MPESASIHEAPPPMWMIDDYAQLVAGAGDRLVAYRLWPHVEDALAKQDPATEEALRAGLVAGQWRIRYEVDAEMVEWVTVVIGVHDLARVDTRRLRTMPPPPPETADGVH